MATLKDLLLRTRKNLQILEERQASYGGNAPLELLNQIEDHQTAVDIISEGLETDLSEADFAALLNDLRPLIIASNLELIDLETVERQIPPLPYEPETILVPAGPFLMGSSEGAEAPQHTVDLPAYRIGKYPVTNAQYAEFVKQSNHRPPPSKSKSWFGKKPKSAKMEHPVSYVTWYDALAYCQWLSEQTKRPYRLPSEAEWEKAARGPEGLVYPWGNDWLEGRCNYNGDDTTPVSQFEAGQSPYGCFDMLGNVWEWTTTIWGTGQEASLFDYPYRLNDGRDDLTADESHFRIYRGGAFVDSPADLRASARKWYAPDFSVAGKNRWWGFRVAQDLS